LLAVKTDRSVVMRKCGNRSKVPGRNLISLGNEVPREYGVTRYRYTVVNDRSVLVDPSTHRIVQVID